MVEVSHFKNIIMKITLYIFKNGISLWCAYSDRISQFQVLPKNYFQINNYTMENSHQSSDVEVQQHDASSPEFVWRFSRSIRLILWVRLAILSCCGLVSNSRTWISLYIHYALQVSLTGSLIRYHLTHFAKIVVSHKALLSSSFNWPMSDFTDTISVQRYAFAPANTKALFNLPFEASVSTLAMQ